MEEEIDLMDMIKYIWSKKIWIILVGIICVIIAVVYTKFLLTPEYTAKSSFILTNDNLETEADVYSYAKLPDRYFEIVNSRTVLEKVVANLKLDKEEEYKNIDKLEKFKEKNIVITYSPANFLIRVAVTTDDAKESMDITNEIVKVSIEEIKAIYNDENIQILDYAKENWKPVNIELLSNIVKFVLVGEILICGYILIKYMFIDGVKKEK